MLRKFLLITLLTSLLAACAPQATPTAVAKTLTFTDGLGHEITLDGPAQRIVSLAPSTRKSFLRLALEVRLSAAMNCPISLKRQKL
jgi:ABC-type Fe3+-hydroxamate transport system substrate-binding protein